MVKVTKATGEALAISPPEIVAVERDGTVTRVYTRNGREYLVMEMPEDVLIQVDAWRRGVERELPGELTR